MFHYLPTSFVDFVEVTDRSDCRYFPVILTAREALGRKLKCCGPGSGWSRSSISYHIAGLADGAAGIAFYLLYRWRAAIYGDSQHPRGARHLAMGAVARALSL